MQATEKLVEAGEFSVNYATAGSGDTMLLLHGSDKRESWRAWEPMLPLGDARSLIIPDLIGYGKSSVPMETPDYRVQAHAMRDFLDRLSVRSADLVGAGWGGQVAIELALSWPEGVRSMTLISSAYDKSQLKPLQKLRKPTLIVYAEDDMVTQLKAGYLLRDAIGVSRLEVLSPVARDPSQEFTMSHRLQKFRTGEILQLVRHFLSDPYALVAEPPELENELRGLATRKEDEKDASTGTP